MLVVDYATVWRHAYFAVAEGIEGVNGFVGGGAWNEMYYYPGGFGGVVLDFAYLDFAFLEGFENGVDNGACRLAVRNLGNGKCLVIDFFDFGTYAQCAATLTVVVARGVDESSGGKVGQKLEVFA